jgi:hypothetical protein
MKGDVKDRVFFCLSAKIEFVGIFEEGGGNLIKKA